MCRMILKKQILEIKRQGENRLMGTNDSKAKILTCSGMMMYQPLDYLSLYQQPNEPNRALRN